MNSVGDAPGYMRNNPAQCAQLYKDYAQHNCDNVLRISSKNVTASPVDSATTHLQSEGRRVSLKAFLADL